jgi:AcrR family transcriptional regulator
MARKPLTKPRKHASQERSRVTVDALVEATARILVKDGFDKISTNRIAERAGVSVGSLYQYFPGKEALIAAVVDRHRQDLMRIVRGALAQAAALPMEQAVRALVAAAIEAHRVDPALHRVLAEQMPRTERTENTAILSGETYDLFRAYLDAHRDEFRAVDLELASFVCVTSIEALTHTAVIHHAERLPDEAFDALVGEATRLIVRYLQ